MAYLEPEDIFDDKELALWAEGNGFVNVDDAWEYVKENHDPEDVYGEEELAKWAEVKGYTKTEGD